MVARPGVRSYEKQKARWNKFMDRVSNFVNSVSCGVHLLGDLNLDTIRWPQLGSLQKNWPLKWFVDVLWEKLVNGAGMLLTETDVTWTSRDGSKSSCLDIHLCNKPEKVKSVKISYEFTKDHHSLIMTRTDADTAPDSTVTKRKWDKVNYDWMELSYWEWWYWNVTPALLKLQNPDEVAERLTCILNVMLDSKWPVVTFKVRPKYAPYVNKKLRDLRKVKRRLWLKWKKTKDMEDYKKMRTVTNKLRQSTRKARKRFFGHWPANV